MKLKRFTVWYFAVSIVFIFLDNLRFVFPALITKILIILSLMVFLHFSVRGKYTLFYRLIMSGLFFSLLGDFILQLAGRAETGSISPDLLFVGGLAAFLLTHLIYLIAFGLPSGKSLIFSSRIYLFFLVLIYGCIMFYFLYPGLGNMKVPVVTYTIVILLMLLAAFNRFEKVNRTSYIIVATGASLFVISDSLIAVNRFYIEFPFAGILIMITYVAAQYLIVLGCIRQNILPGN